MDYKSYIHIEKFGNDEVQGIEMGNLYVFPKIDGSNGVIWAASSWTVRAGSRNRELSLQEDNQGFLAYIGKSEKHVAMCDSYPDLYFYGEWLVPHCLKTYRDDAWNKFYIFDVLQKGSNKFMKYEDYWPILENYGVEYIPPICVLKNGTYENFLHELDNNTFLIKDGFGFGEGIVLKNYEYLNKYGRQTWAKIVRNEYKEKHTRENRILNKEFKDLTADIVDKFLTKPIIDKVYANIVSEKGWSSKDIPRLLNTVYHDFINEELWNIIKYFKQPTIDFKRLNMLVIQKIKELRSELF